MTNYEAQATRPDISAEPAGEVRAERLDPPTNLFALLPSPDQLRSFAAGAASTTSDRFGAGAGDLPESLGIPHALLNPLESLPHRLSIDDVKKQ